MRAITIDADTGKRVYTRKEVADLVGASTPVSYTHLDVYKRQVPGQAFGETYGDFVRLSYGGGMDVLAEGMALINEFIEEL